ncbi:DUF952 domain-containing protein [Notoacmeibacter sp. MSK16QG-6]|uniref:DUF952 domain-containing protein n=1 Tax=Notoacmeibacter sp. MSK16QG-6 TaxID=2957982 RepID=UPI00209CB7E6|nr:DUF952 domain-containing protein [Notoacmeibacter sp. MSK16QG-6]MCP1198598.1 DUF952 domain-containing protein [Notoacmeibacter sp. MSK16QG-6]
MGTMIYKAVPAPIWRQAQQKAEWGGAPVDLADGYIHFSTADQLIETLAKHFAGQEDLVLVAIDEDRLGEALRWEVSRGGALFPHLYAPLSTKDVDWVEELPLDTDGHHRLPERLS